MNKVLLILFSIVPLFLFGQQQYEMLFQEGNEKYSQQKFEEALVSYKKLDSMVHSVELYLNIGHTHLQLEEYGKALLHYEKALTIDSSNKDARASIIWARNKAQLENPDLGWKEGFGKTFSLKTWTVILSLFTWLTLFSFVWVYHQRGFFQKFVSFTLFSLTFVFGAGYFFSSDQLDRYLCVEPDVILRVSPTENSAASARMLEGQYAKVIKEHDNYIFIKSLEEDTQGWAKRSEFLQIWD